LAEEEFTGKMHDVASAVEALRAAGLPVREELSGNGFELSHPELEGARRRFAGCGCEHGGLIRLTLWADDVGHIEGFARFSFTEVARLLKRAYEAAGPKCIDAFDRPGRTRGRPNLRLRWSSPPTGTMASGLRGVVPSSVASDQGAGGLVLRLRARSDRGRGRPCCRWWRARLRRVGPGTRRGHVVEGPLSHSS
jgi:hypothetical protein